MEELDVLRDKGQFRTLHAVSHRDVTNADFNGKRYLNLSSNDYLGFGGNRELLEEFLENASKDELLDTLGLTSSSSPEAKPNVC